MQISCGPTGCSNILLKPSPHELIHQLEESNQIALAAPLAPINTLIGWSSKVISLIDRKPLILNVFSFDIVLTPCSA